MRINITSMILGSTQYCYEKGIVKSVEIVDEDNMHVVFVDSDKITNKVNICCPATISVEFTQVGKQYRSFVDSFVNRKNENLTKQDIDNLVAELGYKDRTAELNEDTSLYNTFYNTENPTLACVLEIPLTGEIVCFATLAEARKWLNKEKKQEYVLHNIDGEYFVTPVTEEKNTGIAHLEDGSRAICAHDGEVLEVVEEDVELEEIRKQIKMENHWKQACNEPELWEMKPDCQCDACIKNRKPARELKMHTLNVIVHLEGREEEARDITLTSDSEGYLVVNGVIRYVRKDTVFYTWYEIFPLPQEGTYMCEKCDKALHEDSIAVFRSIDIDTGGDIGVVYCKPCYDNMMNKIYGPIWSAEKEEEEEPFTPMEVQICDAFPWDTDHACLTHFCIGRVQEKDTYCDMCVKRAQETLKPFDVFVDNEKYYWCGIDINDAIYSASALLTSGTYKTIEAYHHYESKADLFNDGYQRLYAQKVAIKESDYLRKMTVFSPDVPNGTGYMMFDGEIVPVRFLEGRGWYEVGLSQENAEKAFSEYPVWEDVIQAYSDFKSTEHAEKWWNSNIRLSIS